jgi:hypothetical protein
LAAELLPFSAVSTGPADDLGGGALEGILALLLQSLREFPGTGWDAIEVGLNCRVSPTRNVALRALEQWPRQQWPAGAIEALQRQLFQEPDDKLRARVRQLLSSSS